MENFGILFSIPITFGMSIVYCCVVAKVLRAFDQVYALLYIPSLVVLGAFLLEMALLLSMGILGIRAHVGPVFHPAHIAIVFLSPPALANVLVLRPIFCKWYVAAVLCAILAVFLVILSYEIGGVLYGIDAMPGPYS